MPAHRIAVIRLRSSQRVALPFQSAQTRARLPPDGDNMIDQLQTRLPAIAIHARDLERLRQLADAAAETYPATAEFLAREIERAAVLPLDHPADGVVTMQAAVTFRDDVTAQTRSVTLVYPDEADVDTGRISVLTPIGAALIGLSPGQAIAFQTPTGGWRSLTVLSVVPPS